MKDEIFQLFRCLQMLIGSCADHEITTDIFVSPADPVAYHEALDRIMACTGRIVASGLTREQLLQLFMEHGGDYSPDIERLIDPRDIVPLIGTAFTPVQKNLVCAACRDWAMATAPGDPGGMATRIRSAVYPLTLADLLSPEATGMLRFPTIILLQNAARGLVELVRPAWYTSNRIIVPATDDLPTFYGQLNVAIFWFLSEKGKIPVSIFQEPVIQALYDTGVLCEGGVEALGHSFGDDGPRNMELFEAGRELARDRESVNDIRMLIRLVLSKDTDTARTDSGTGSDGVPPHSCHRVVQRSGHVLAGFIAARAEASDQTFVSYVIDFISSVAARPFGRAEPGPGQLRELERNMQEYEQLIRAVTGHYVWRATPMPPGTAGYRPVADLWPGRQLILYDQEEMAYRSTEASKALLMEALYRYRYGLRPPYCDTKMDLEEWYSRLVSVLGVPRAVLTGTLVHPGVTRWLMKLCQEESDPVNRMVNLSQVSSLSLPDQFLEAAVFEGRTGEPTTDIRDASVKHALDVTSVARKEISKPQITDEICLSIINEQIWPVFRQICYQNPATAQAGNFSAGRPREGVSRNIFIPRGTAPRVDTTVPNAHHPGNNLTGKAIEGKGKSLLDNDGLLVPGNHSGTGAHASGHESPKNDRNVQPEGPGGGTAPCPFPGEMNGHFGQGDQGSGIPETARRMMETCAKSGELLDELFSPDIRAETKSGEQCYPRETISALRDLADKIDEMAEILEREVGRSRDTNKPGMNGWTHPAGIPDRIRENGKHTDTLVKTSENVRKAASEYRDALGKVDRTMESSGSDNSSIRHLTGMTKKAFMDLQQAGTEFQQLSGGPPPAAYGKESPMVRLLDADDDLDSDGMIGATHRGKLEPSFVTDSSYNPGVWESLSYFDASFDDGSQAASEGPSSGTHSRDATERRFEQNTQALTREAELYLSALRQRTRSDWETIDEKAEHIRRVALFESHTVGQDDYAAYQRFYQPVAGLIGVARKNIQQALQKTRSTRDLNELTTGDDIDEENLAAVRTTMRIFRDRGREPDKTRWCISLLIDASSSMHDETVARKLQATIQAAILFGEAVNRITGIQFEIAAFSDTEYIPLKRYQDDWNIHQGCYLIRQVVQATGGTNDVGAVSSALDRMNRLRMAAGANRMIFVISDGQSGVGGRDQMRTILSTNKDTRIFGWGIGPDMEKVEETYRPYGAWVRDIADLPGSMGEVLRRELGRPAMAGWKDDRADPGTGQEKPEGEGLCTD